MLRVFRVRVLVILLGLGFGVSTPLLAQRSDRATISGVVIDNQGAAVPGATVTIKNEDTGVETVLVTNSSGAYTSPPLVLGRYAVTVDLTGFKKTVSSGILLEGGNAFRHDVALQVGDLSESVEVKAATGISETRPDVSHTVDEKYYKDLPFVTGSDVRLAESVLLMQPGYLPMRPNGDPMFRGSQFNSRINGGQAMATENFFDGAAFGYASGHQQSHESTAPVEAIQEVKVISTTYSAQYGHTSGGFIEYTSKSGTNAYRGSVYEYMSDDAFNKNTVFAERGGIDKTPIRNDNFGFTLGGPVRLPGYDGRNKTHFFTNIDYTRIRSGTIAGFGNTTPTDAFKNGNFGALLTNNQIGTDALGRPILQGQIFDPQTTRMVNGIPVRDPFPGNVIPANHPLRSVVASRIVPLMVQPDREGLANNVAGIGTGDQTWELDARNIMARVDHNFTPAFKSSTSFYWNRRPSVRNCEGVDGCNYEHNPETESAQNTDYYGSGFFQRISTHHAHQQFDWIISNNLLSHSTIAWDRWFMGGNHLSAGANWPQRLWEGTASPTGGIVAQDAGPPHDAIQRRQRPLHANRARGMAAVRLREERSLAVLERHHVGEGASRDQVGIRVPPSQLPGPRLGGRRRRGQLQLRPPRHRGVRRVRQQPEPDRRSVCVLPAGAGPDVESEHPGVPHVPGDVHRPVRQRRVQGLRQADADARPALRLPVGPDRTRRHVLDLQPDDAEPRSWRNSRRDHLRGRGSGPHGTAQVRGRAREMPGVRAWASRIDSMTNRPFAGATGSTTRTSRSASSPVRRTQGFASNPFAPNNTNGIFPAHHLDQGFPQDRIQFPPFIDPTINLGGNVIAVTPDGLTLPRFQNWSVTYQRQLTDNMMLDVSYIGNRGSRLNHHFETLGVGANMNDPECAGAGHAGAAGQHQLAARPERRHHAVPIPGSTATWPRRCGSSRSTSTSNGAACRSAGASTTRWNWCWSVGSRVVCRRASATPTRTS